MREKFLTIPLGQPTTYDESYNPDKLFPIERQKKREEMGITSPLPFYGYDLWNHYEVSWLNENGKPIVAMAEIIYDCESPAIIESKSLKLYFNTFNNSRFKNDDEVRAAIIKDLAERIGAQVQVKLTRIAALKATQERAHLASVCLDDLEVECTDYHVQSDYLMTEANDVEEVLHTNLLKANCPVTNQPDWATVEIAYAGKKINHAALLQYIVSYRNHSEFHEQCVERIFIDIMRHCQPNKLSVYARFTRRGGIDINPYRSTEKYASIQNMRLCRQ